MAIKKEYADLGQHSSDLKYTEAENKNIRLLQRIQMWQAKQKRFMPELTSWEPLTDFNMDDAPELWSVDLVLPSSLPENERSDVCIAGLAIEEFSIREEW